MKNLERYTIESPFTYAEIKETYFVINEKDNANSYGMRYTI
mgnify:CR=1 FL=1